MKTLLENLLDYVRSDRIAKPANSVSPLHLDHAIPSGAESRLWIERFKKFAEELPAPYSASDLVVADYDNGICDIRLLSDLERLWRREAINLKNYSAFSLVAQWFRGDEADAKAFMDFMWVPRAEIAIAGGFVVWCETNLAAPRLLVVAAQLDVESSEAWVSVPIKTPPTSPSRFPTEINYTKTPPQEPSHQREQTGARKDKQTHRRPRGSR